jgi:sec-independent protein translocase protein TatA
MRPTGFLRTSTASVARAKYTSRVGALQPLHLLVILAIVLVIFGAGRLSEVGGALGKGVKEFRSTVEDKDKTVGGTAAGFCTSCGARLPESGARFCTQCGASAPA